MAEVRGIVGVGAMGKGIPHRFIQAGNSVQV